MLTLNKEEFKVIFEQYKKITFNIERTAAGLLKLPYDISELYNSLMLYKLSVKQMNNIIDWSFENDIEGETILKLCALFSDKETLKRNIPVESYEHFVLKFSNYERNYFFEDIIFDVLYFRTRDYDEQLMKKQTKIIKKLEEITYKYLDNFKFTKKESIKNIYYYSRDKKEYIYQNYKNPLEFNIWLNTLASDVPINVDDFKIDDNIEEFLWQQKNE